MAEPTLDITVPLIGNIQIDGLTQGTSWVFGDGPRTIEYSFHRIVAFGPPEVWVSPAQIPADVTSGIASALQQWANVADITFQEVLGQPFDGDQSSADIAFALTGTLLQEDGVAGFGIYPDVLFAEFLLEDDLDDDRGTWPQPEGDVAIDHVNMGGFAPGNYGYAVALHEIGHALGLKHPHDDGFNFRPLLPVELDTWQWTVMSYNDHPQSTLAAGNQRTPMPLDILAIQYIYGANMSYQTGDDTYTLAGNGVVRTIWDAGGVDTISAAGLSAATTINLTAGSLNHHGVNSLTAIAYDVTIENVTGGSGNDTLTGNAADNVLDGGAGNDTLAGGDGNDTYVLSGAGDKVNEGAIEGTDTVLSPVNYVLGLHVERLTLTGNALSGTGNDIANIIIGNSLDNLLAGGGSVDSLSGGGGNDTLDGGTGTDQMEGGAGDDTFIVDDSGDAATDEVSGIDRVLSAVSFALGLGVENLTLTGAGDINGTGNALANVLRGNAGINVLTGVDGNDTYYVGAGDSIVEGEGGGADSVFATFDFTLADDLENLTLIGAATSGTGNGGANTLTANALASTLAGGGGDDSYFLRGANDVVQENPGGGTDDTVFTRFSHILGENVENLTLTGSSAVNGTGNGAENELTGNARANVLDGQGGADTMAGEGGDDTYLVDAANEVEEDANGGFDTILSGIDYVLPAHVENLVLLAGAGDIDATGNDLNNTLTGNEGANVLEGGGGRDVLIGGAGDDTYVVDTRDKVVESQGGGEDTVETDFSYTLASYLENLTLTGSANTRATGNALANEITGNGGNNLIDGMGGIDSLDGGDGDDSLVFDAKDESVDGGAGIDTLLVTGFRQTVDLTKIDDDIFTGIEAIDLTGKGRNTLKLTVEDVLALSETDTLRVDGNATSKLISTGEGWELQQTVGGYHEYTSGTATLFVDTEILLTLS